MKMSDGGFRPAYNVKFATDHDSDVIVGVMVTAQSSEHHDVVPMLDQLEARMAGTPRPLCSWTGGSSRMRPSTPRPPAGCACWPPCREAACSEGPRRAAAGLARAERPDAPRNRKARAPILWGDLGRCDPGQSDPHRRIGAPGVLSPKCVRSRRAGEQRAARTQRRAWFRGAERGSPLSAARCGPPARDRCCSPRSRLRTPGHRPCSYFDAGVATSCW